jgi:hypothetical protein
LDPVNIALATFLQQPLLQLYALVVKLIVFLCKRKPGDLAILPVPVALLGLRLENLELS